MNELVVIGSALTALFFGGYVGRLRWQRDCAVRNLAKSEAALLRVCKELEEKLGGAEHEWYDYFMRDEQ